MTLEGGGAKFDLEGGGGGRSLTLEGEIPGAPLFLSKTLHPYVSFLVDEIVCIQQETLVLREKKIIRALF